MIHLGVLEKLTDEEIALRASKERFLFELIVERYSDALARYIRRLGIPGQEDINDILQEVFIKSFRNLQQFDVSQKFSSWIYRIAHNETMSFFRSTKVRPQAHYVDDMDSALQKVKSDINIEYGAEVQLSFDKVMEVINTLDQKLRSVVILRYLEDRSYQEISDIMRIPAGTVATLLHRAKKKIQQSSK